MRDRIVNVTRLVRVYARASAAALSLAAGVPLMAAQDATVSCATWQACRDMALEAASRGEPETAHDLAWRAVQTGPPRSPELMFLLARMQSLSGRADDALVMLRRLAEAGGGAVAADALTSPDFRRVHAQPGWPAVQTLLVEATSPAAPAPAPSATAATSADAITTADVARPAASPAVPDRPAATPEIEAASGDVARAADPVIPSGIDVVDSLRFASAGFPSSSDSRRAGPSISYAPSPRSSTR
jgi:hypothetical protein